MLISGISIKHGAIPITINKRTHEKGGPEYTHSFISHIMHFTIYCYYYLFSYVTIIIHHCHIFIYYGADINIDLKKYIY